MEENIIKRKREELGYSQSQFSEMSGVNFRTLQDYEQGRKPIPSIKGDVLYRISTNLGCSMEELLIESLSRETQRMDHLARYKELVNQLLDARHTGQIHTPFDDVFRTLSVDCSRLLIPLINVAFGENYDDDALVEQRQNGHFSHRDDGAVKKTQSDSNFIILEKNGIQKSYQVECQSRVDHSILLRLFEYASAVATENSKLEEDVLRITYPRSALLYLRHNVNTPDQMKVLLETPGGEVTWKIPVVKSQVYSVDDIFEKHLYLLIPFYLLTYEDQLSEIEKDSEKLDGLKRTYEDIFARLEAALERGNIDSFQWYAIRNLSRRILDHLTGKYTKIQKEVRTIMGGQVLEYEEKTIWRRAEASGISQGISQGISRGIAQTAVASVSNLMSALSLSVEQALDILKISKSDYEKYQELLKKQNEK